MGGALGGGRSRVAVRKAVEAGAGGFGLARAIPEPYHRLVAGNGRNPRRWPIETLRRGFRFVAG